MLELDAPIRRRGRKADGSEQDESYGLFLPRGAQSCACSQHPFILWGWEIPSYSPWATPGLRYCCCSPKTLLSQGLSWWDLIAPVSPRRTCVSPGNWNPFLRRPDPKGYLVHSLQPIFRWAASKEQLGCGSMLGQQEPLLPPPEMPKLGCWWMAQVRRDWCVLSDLPQTIASHPASPGCFLGIIHSLSQVTGLTKPYSFDICNHKVLGKKMLKTGCFRLPLCSEFWFWIALASVGAWKPLQTVLVLHSAMQILYSSF